MTNYTADTDDVTLYLDQYGYVMDATSQSDDGDKSVAVLKAYQTLNKDGELVPMIKGVTSDGETVNWETDRSSIMTLRTKFVFTLKRITFIL